MTSPTQGQPPTGASPATSPSANRGREAAGLAKLSMVVKQLESLIPDLGVASDAGRAAAEALLKLAKHIPAGSIPSGVENAQMQKMQAQRAQNAPMIAAMRAGGAGAGGAPGAAPPGAA